MHALNLALVVLGGLANPQTAAPYDENTLVIDIPNDWDVEAQVDPSWDRVLRNEALKASVSIRRTRPYEKSVRELAEPEAKGFRSVGAEYVSPVVGDALQACFEVKTAGTEASADPAKRKKVLAVFRTCYRRMPKTHTSLVKFFGHWREDTDKAARKAFDAIVRNTRLE